MASGGEKSVISGRKEITPVAPESVVWELISSAEAACKVSHVSSADSMSVSHCLLSFFSLNYSIMPSVMCDTGMLGEQKASFLVSTGFAKTK